MNQIPYHKAMEALIAAIPKGEVPRLMLHACCAPCSSAVLEKLSEHFAITILYYNPNIATEEEYHKREDELRRLLALIPQKHPIELITLPWEQADFLAIAEGLEDLPEGGARCHKCYELRMRRTAELAKDGDFDYFTTTLSISPLKSAKKINEIGENLADTYGVPHLPSDFKKGEGYKRSIELSREYGLYRQDYCGCIWSMRRDLIPPEK